MILVERDYVILNEVYRWRFCLGRHLKVLCGFTGARATDRRLKLLVETGYIERTKLLFGIPFIYTLPHKGRILIGANKREDKIRLEHIAHDIAVLDTACYFIEQGCVGIGAIQTEKELHAKDGFGVRKHRPDFVYTHENMTYAVEIEMTLKAKDHFQKNVKDNYLTYDGQIWVVPKRETKIIELLTNWQASYDNLEILSLEVVTGA